VIRDTIFADAKEQRNVAEQNLLFVSEFSVEFAGESYSISNRCRFKEVPFQHWGTEL
jgi:hypothetical protein